MCDALREVRTGVKDTMGQPATGDERIAFIKACWHREIVNQCHQAFAAEMARLGSSARIDLYEVPGAFEIPLHAKLLARSGRYIAIVAAGLVVDGGIYRHEYVADAVISGMMRVQVETEVPIISAVLIPQQFHEHKDHRLFFHEHLLVKGTEAAAACLKAVENIRAARLLADSAKSC
jgi:6,7-dimethyl-8-ribityllumazine synthase